MGGKESKLISLSYEEACKRITETEKRRFHDAFRVYSTNNSYISKQTLLNTVLGESVPTALGERIYALLGTGGRGIQLRELVTLLVLLARGNREEKIKLLFGVLSTDGSCVEYTDCIRYCGEWEGDISAAQLSSLFTNGNKVGFEAFSQWIEKNVENLEIGRWLLSPNNSLSLICHTETPTFYQTLAGVTHLTEKEVLELEKRFWVLAGKSPSHRISLSILSPLVSPPLPHKLVQGLFQAFDENQDGHLDFKELSCGVSAACRGPEMERQKFCFKIFDVDRDGQLNSDEVEMMMEAMVIISEQNKLQPATNTTASSLTKTQGVKISEAEFKSKVDKAISELKSGKDKISQEDFLVWTVESPLAQEFATLLFQLCHVVLGLRPGSRKEEGEIVRGWLHREEAAGFSPGQVWHLLPMTWWTAWHAYVNWVEAPHTPATTFNSLTKKKGTVASSLAADTGSVVTTGYTPLDSETKSPCASTSSSRPGTPVSSSTTTSSTSSASARSTMNGPLTRVASTPGSLGTLSTPVSGSPVTPRRSVKQIAVPGRPGMIDNSTLIQTPVYRSVTVLTGEGGKLKSGSRLVRGRDYELVPERLWKFLVDMYRGSPALPRQVIRTKNGEVELELNPPNIKILKHQTIQRQSNVSPMVGGYNAAAMQAGLSTAAYSGLVGGSTGPPTVVRRFHAYQAAFSRRTAISQISEFLCNRLQVKTEDLRLWFYRGDENSMRLLDDENSTLEDAGFQDDDSLLAEIRSRDGTWPEEISNLCGEKRHLTEQQPLKPGIAGLNNLGNTCYMNAAIQVMAGTKILAQYFKHNCHLYELNRTNPMGMKGHIAKRFGDLVREIWSGEAKTIAPIKLRWTVGKYRPDFASFQQQDSQELLVFLLDGLHEDLNRVTDKPYTELEDSAGRPDLEVSAEAWDNHLLRNKSIIVDLFHGQLKSKVTCKVCQHESVRFDPFFNLSLPLPMERCVSIEVVMILQDGSTPVKYGLAMDMEEKGSAIPPKLARLTGVPPQNMVLVDIIQSQIRVISIHEHKLRSLSTSTIFAYELSKPAEVKVSVAAGHEDNRSIPDIQRSAQARLKGKHENGKKAAEEGKSIGEVGKGEQVGKSGDEGGGNTGEGGGGGDGKKSAEAQDSDHSQTSTDSSQAEGPDECEGVNLSEPRRHHSRASSASSTLTSGTLDSDRGGSTSLPPDLGDYSQGIMVCLHRKMVAQEYYFLSSGKYKPDLFGIPLLITYNPNTTGQELYALVWEQVGRLVSPLPPHHDRNQSNHATDCDDSLGYEYPFVLRAVKSGGGWCSWCPWSKMCRGCQISHSPTPLATPSSFLAIDWDPTALHLRYLAGSERSWREDVSVEASRRAATEPITLGKCLEAFTQEEHLGEKEKVYCSNCKTQQLAVKKLQIWRLPPVLIVHLKRFQCVNNKWIKSHKIVDFPINGLDFTEYLAAVPSETLKRYQELSKRTSRLSTHMGTKAETIAEDAEPNWQISEENLPAATLAEDVVPASSSVLAASEALTELGGRSDSQQSDTHSSAMDEDPNDSGIESNLGSNVYTNLAGQSGSTPPPSTSTSRLNRGESAASSSRLERGESTSSDVFDLVSDASVSSTTTTTTQSTSAAAGSMNLADPVSTDSRMTQNRLNSRVRSISTSLAQHPIVDHDLQDFHQHNLEPGHHPLHIKYNMYAMVCHSGVLGGGHYVSYGKTGKDKWYCHNDSSCKEVSVNNIDKSTAYILLYEREGLSISDYMPDLNGRQPDNSCLDEELDNDFKKQCNLM